MNIVWVAISAFVGALACSLLGFLDSQETFNARKFTASAIRAVIAGVGFAVAYQYTDSLTTIDLGLAFLGGAGVDAGGNRLSGYVKAKLGME